MPPPGSAEPFPSPRAGMERETNFAVQPGEWRETELDTDRDTQGTLCANIGSKKKSDKMQIETVANNLINVLE